MLIYQCVHDVKKILITWMNLKVMENIDCVGLVD